MADTGGDVVDASERTALAAVLDPSVPPGRLIERILGAARAHLRLEVSFVSQFLDGQRIFRWAGGDVSVIDVRVGDADPLEATFCSRVVAGSIDPVVHDTAMHPVTRGKPRSLRRGAGCYVGVPIMLSDGTVYGTLCCLGREPNVVLGPDDVGYLRFAAGLVASLLEGDLPARRERDQLFERTSRVIATGDVSIVHQPIVRLDDGALLGVEALSRFGGSARGPAEWFEDAWRVGLGPRLEVCALRRALDSQRAVPSPAFLAVNVSPETLFEADFDESFDGVDAARVVVEVGEHASVLDYAPISTRLDELRDRGMRIAIDDLGSGYAGLRHIVELRPDVLKIDRHVVSGARHDPLRRTVAAAVSTVAAHMGALVVAEGIETADERDAVEMLGVTAGQGFRLAPPAPPQDGAARSTSAARATAT